MMARASLGALLFGLSVAAQAGPEVEVTALQLPKTVRQTCVLHVDTDGDGLQDLVLGCFDEASRRRELRVHRRSAGSPAFTYWMAWPPVMAPRAWT